jgi:hypothetical protein
MMLHICCARVRARVCVCVRACVRACLHSRKQELPALPCIVHVGPPRAQSGGQSKSLVQGVCVCLCVYVCVCVCLCV